MVNDVIFLFDCFCLVKFYFLDFLPTVESSQGKKPGFCTLRLIKSEIKVLQQDNQTKKIFSNLLRVQSESKRHRVK